MANPRETLGLLVRSHREQMNLTQEALAEACETNRSVVAHLEQGLRVPTKPDVLKRICEKVGIPGRFWVPFTQAESIQRFEFEDTLSELVGRPVTFDGHDPGCLAAAEERIATLFQTTLSDAQTLDLLNSVLVFYGVPPVSQQFFDRYLTPAALSSIPSLDKHVRDYQKHAIRLFSSLREAYVRMNSSGDALGDLLTPLLERGLGPYHARSEWDVIEIIDDARLPDLGYVSAVRVKQEGNERSAVQKFLRELADAIRQKDASTALGSISEKQKRRIDSLLRKLGANIRHGLFSPLFAPDPDVLEREAELLGPKTEVELERIGSTQESASRNLARYLSADHLDVYVATSMRSDADYVSVNHFAKALFSDDQIRPLKLRYFNPTQSWIDDRIAKGLVEALMLRRCSVAIYMAQKADTFGKDSEASVALGQGKPVIVYVPKLKVGEDLVDTEALFRLSRAEMVRLVNEADASFEVDDAIDDEALVGVVLSARLSKASDAELVAAVATQWHDFDLYGESTRVAEPRRADYRRLLDGIRRGEVTGISSDLRADVIGILVATAIRFEARAKLFREVHPLALQVILSTGVLNGILVVRSVEQCARILADIVRNVLDLELTKDEQNYRLVERTTGSTVRVVSRHQLLRYAFERHYPAVAGS